MANQQKTIFSSLYLKFIKIGLKTYRKFNSFPQILAVFQRPAPICIKFPVPVGP